jgi:uncharacterized membrane protein YdjX (TVP38/TMEM64 family)
MDRQAADITHVDQKRIGLRTYLGAGALVAFLVAVIILHRKLNLWQYLAEENLGSTITAIRAWVGRFGVWGPAIFTLAGSGAFMITTPALLIIYLSVILFGYVTGGIASTLALLGGTTLIYYTGQALGRPFVQGIFGNRFARIEERFSRRELMNVIYLRLLFFMSPWMNWLLCVTGVRYRNVLFGTLLGTVHNIILNVWLGGLIVDLIQSGRSLNPMKTPILFIPVAIGFVIFIVVRIADSLYQRRRASISD